MTDLLQLEIGVEPFDYEVCPYDYLYIPTKPIPVEPPKKG